MDLPYKTNSKDIFLKLIDISDVNNNYVTWLNDKYVTMHTDLISNKHSIKSTKNYVNKINKSHDNFLYGIFYLHSKQKKIHIGNIKVGPILKLHKSAFIAYLIGDKRFWNKNIGTTVIKKTLEICKKKHKLKKINAGVSELNISSQKILIKNNFKLEGVFKKQIYFKNRRLNLFQYGKII